MRRPARIPAVIEVPQSHGNKGTLPRDNEFFAPRITRSSVWPSDSSVTRARSWSRRIVSFACRSNFGSPGIDDYRRVKSVSAKRGKVCSLVRGIQQLLCRRSLLGRCGQRTQGKSAKSTRDSCLTCHSAAMRTLPFPQTSCVRSKNPAPLQIPCLQPSRPVTATVAGRHSPFHRWQEDRPR